MSAAQASPVANTIAYLRKCQAARKAGYTVSYTTDPTWLVDMAINRRAGWVEDLHSRTCYDGKAMPWKATGDAQRHLIQIAHDVNTPRLTVRLQRLGEWRKWLAKRLPERFTDGWQQ